MYIEIIDQNKDVLLSNDYTSLNWFSNISVQLEMAKPKAVSIYDNWLLSICADN